MTNEKEKKEKSMNFFLLQVLSVKESGKTSEIGRDPSDHLTTTLLWCRVHQYVGRTNYHLLGPPLVFLSSNSEWDVELVL